MKFSCCTNLLPNLHFVSLEIDPLSRSSCYTTLVPTLHFVSSETDPLSSSIALPSCEQLCTLFLLKLIHYHILLPHNLAANSAPCVFFEADPVSIFLCTSFSPALHPNFSGTDPLSNVLATHLLLTLHSASSATDPSSSSLAKHFVAAIAPLIF